MNINIFTLLPCLMMAILLSSCNKPEKENGKATSDDQTLSIKVQLPTMQDAVKHIQTHAARTQQTVMVSTHYYKEVQIKKRCDQIDRDLGRCSGADSFAPFGYKMVMVNKRNCCRSEEKLVSKITGNWVATYLEPKNEWEITLEYKDDAKEEQKVSWSISLNQSDGLQVSVGDS